MNSSLTEAQLEAIRHPAPEPVNALLKQSDDDPTFEKIVGFYPPFRYPREIVGVPEHVQEIGVDYLGRLDNSPWAPPKAWFLIGDSLTPFGDAWRAIQATIAQRFHSGGHAQPRHRWRAA